MDGKEQLRILLRKRSGPRPTPKAETLRAGRGLQLLSLTPKEHTIVAAAFSAAQCWREALHTLPLLAAARLHADAKARHAALSGCAGYSWHHAQGLLQVEAALERAAQASTCDPGGRRFDDLADAAALATRACGAARLWARAGAALALLALRSVQLSLRARTAAVSAFSAAAAWAAALRTARDTQRKAPKDVRLGTTLAGACSRAAQWLLALQALETSTPSVEATIGTDRIFQGALVDALAKGQKLQEALEVLKTSRAMGVLPNLMTLTAAMGACGSSTLAGGRRSWELAISLAAERRSEGSGADIIACNHLVAACDRGFQWEAALFSLGQLSVRADTVTWNSVLSACSSFSWQRVAQGLLRMRTQQFLPGAEAFGAALGAAERAEQWRTAMRFWAASCSQSSLTCAAAISACQSWRCALELHETWCFSAGRPSVESLTALATCCGKCSSWLGAQAALRVLQRSLEPGPLIFTSLAKSAACVSAWQNAVAWAQDAGASAEALCAAVAACEDAPGDWDGNCKYVAATLSSTLPDRCITMLRPKGSGFARVAGC
ncbi:unnamed protein product [Effrenium voratum]|nr:unnamed protein product [Effrenium voratum]